MIRTFCLFQLLSLNSCERVLLSVTWCHRSSQRTVKVTRLRRPLWHQRASATVAHFIPFWQDTSHCLCWSDIKVAESSMWRTTGVRSRTSAVRPILCWCHKDCSWSWSLHSCMPTICRPTRAVQRQTSRRQQIAFRRMSLTSTPGCRLIGWNWTLKRQNLSGWARASRWRRSLCLHCRQKINS